jgi:hypothetical protein
VPFSKKSKEEIMSEEPDEEPRVVPITRARQGVTPHVTRYVLIYGLGLVIAAFVLVYLVMHKHS